MVVIVIVGGLVAVRLAGGGKKTTTGPSGAADSQIVTALSSIPESTFAAVGSAGVQAAPSPITGQPVLTADGKPLVVYMGAEYCPFCAAERWAMVVALSRFGTFSNLGQTASSPNDTFPNTPTLTFHGSTYTSKYLSFQGVETQSNEIEGNAYKTLDTPTAQQQELINKFDAPPYVDKNSTGSIPFIDFANQAMVSGSSYSPQLFAGKTQQQVADALQDPNSDIAKAVGGAANAFTAQLCKLTNNQPADVCSSAAAQAYSGQS